MDEYIKKLSSAIGVEESLVRKHISKSIRFMNYRGLYYAVFRRDLFGYREGTTVLLGRQPLIVHGYPSIQRLALLEGVTKHMIDRIIVEEKMNGYNVRTIVYEDEVYAITRGGFICPYTTARIRKLYGKNLKLLFNEHPDIVVAGEVVGTENPYVVYDYPEAGGFDYFVFDILHDGKLQPLKLRDEIAEKYSLKTVKTLGTLDKHDLDALKEIINRLEKERREGVVIKDPEHRVPPLKYTTVYINIRDIAEGMRYPFDEGRGYLFSRIIRLIAQGYEYRWNKDTLNKIALELGKAILDPAINTLKERANGKLVAATYRLVFPSLKDYEDYIDYVEKIGLDFIIRIAEERPDGSLIVEITKLKDTNGIYSKILETGYSPLD